MKKLLITLTSGMLFVFQYASAELNDAATSALPATERTQSGNASAQVNVQADSAAPATSTEKQSATIDPASEQAGFSHGSVVRSSFTTAIDDREPVDNIDKMANEGKVYFFTELRDMSGQTAIHRWEHDGEVKAEVEFKVGGPRWRVWSSKSFNPEGTGEWKVSVLNGANEVIKEQTLNLTASTITNEPVTENPQNTATDHSVGTELQTTEPAQ